MDIERLLRTSTNISVAVRFLGDRIDELEKVLKKFDENCEMKDEVIRLDEIHSDLDKLYELFYNLSSDLNDLTKGVKDENK